MARCGLRARLDFPIIAAVTALVLSGCMQTAAPVASGQPRNDLDAMAYGQPYSTPDAAVPARIGPGRFRRRHRCASRQLCGFAAKRRSYRRSSPAAYPRPAEAGLRRTYRLDAGDKTARRGLWPGRPHQHLRHRCRRLDHHAADRRGPARGRTPAGLAAEITAKLRNGYIREPSVAVEMESYRPFFILGEVAAPGQYPYVPNMTSKARWRSPAASRPAPGAIRHADPHRQLRLEPHIGPARHADQSRRYRPHRRALVLSPVIAGLRPGNPSSSRDRPFTKAKLMGSRCNQDGDWHHESIMPFV